MGDNTGSLVETSNLQASSACIVRSISWPLSPHALAAYRCIIYGRVGVGVGVCGVALRCVLLLCWQEVHGAVFMLLLNVQSVLCV